MTAQLTFAGAAGGVTGSCYHLVTPGGTLVIDCGTFQGEHAARNDDAFPFDARQVDAVVLTHGHLDHVGRLPLLTKRGFRGPIYGHAATLDIAREIIKDSAKLAQHQPGAPLFDDIVVAECLQQFRPVPSYKAPFSIGGLRCTLFDAGHILGSASVAVEWQGARGPTRALFSGDLGVRGAPLIADPNITWPFAFDYIVTESTYGTKTHPSRDAVRALLREVLTRALTDGGKVLIPAFSIGRTQELIYEIDLMKARGELAEIPVIIDGPLGLSATAIYAKHQACYDAEARAKLRAGDPPLEFDSLIAATNAKASRAAVATTGPVIVIAGSGMCQGGRIRNHLRAHLGERRTDVLLVGYQAEGTLGRALQRGDKEVYIDGEPHPVAARITTITGLSAHADQPTLTAWLDAVPKLATTRVFVTHGEPQTSAAYAEHVQTTLKVATHVPAFRESLALP